MVVVVCVCVCGGGKGRGEVGEVQTSFLSIRHRTLRLGLFINHFLDAFHECFTGAGQPGGEVVSKKKKLKK